MADQGPLSSCETHTNWIKYWDLLLTDEVNLAPHGEHTNLIHQLTLDLNCILALCRLENRFDNLRMSYVGLLVFLILVRALIGFLNLTKNGGV